MGPAKWAGMSPSERLQTTGATSWRALHFFAHS